MTPTPEKVLGDAFDAVNARFEFQLSAREIGRVERTEGGIIGLTGFSRVGFDEVIEMSSGSKALAMNINEDSVAAVALSPGSVFQVGDTAERTHREVSIPVGEGLLGLVIDPLGTDLSTGAATVGSEHFSIDRRAPEILQRAPVQRPLHTGIKAIDATIPIGRGQRELILGDRQTGKTSLAVETILNQGEDMVCVYCAIGQRQSAVKRVIDLLHGSKMRDRSIILVASGDDPPGLQYLAPYSATSIAEWFMLQGHDVLIVYDDLTCHARAYRELSLLLDRPPGREAYPGDIFYLHARLLERATQLRSDLGGGSITALPIVETKAQDISAYIPTNLISITDGQLVLRRELFERGHFPALDIGRSVSRVGGKAQWPAFRSVSGDLKLFYSQFEELEAFARFGTRIDDQTRARLVRGRRVREALKQRAFEPQLPIEQIAILLAATQGGMDDFEIEDFADAEHRLLTHVRGSDLWLKTDLRQPLSEQQIETLLSDIDGVFRAHGKD
ncbi:MAG: F0F1 ATP synthase subunit alpha [Henriciella sp.]|nr:F0F1 ATP synthase subunit alpha [Henriciella sp.]